MIDYLIIGQGLAGTILHRKLTLKGKDVMILDQGHKDSSSIVAAGMINPITGRKYVKSWRIEDFLPVAKSTYRELELLLNVQLYLDVNIHRALYSIKDENVWHSRLEDPRSEQFIIKDADTSIYLDTINNVLSYGSLYGGQVNIKTLISTYRSYLKREKKLIEDTYESKNLVHRQNYVSYKGIDTKGIIFAEGHKATNNPLWSYLPFEPVKGEVLLVKIEGKPFKDVLRHKMFITPIEDNLYWVGSGYKWDFKDNEPTEKGREILIEQLDAVLNLPYTIIKHIAGIRPSVKGRKPLLGEHPKHKYIYLFNGMGTKGTSLAPYWADHFVSYLIGKNKIDQEVNLNRYTLPENYLG